MLENYKWDTFTCNVAYKSLLLDSPSTDDVIFASMVSDLNTISSIEASKGTMTDGYCIKKERKNKYVQKLK